MGGDPARRNQNLYCTYHQEKGHITEQCRVFKDHLEKLVKAGHWKKFIAAPEGSIAGQTLRKQGNTLPLPLGVIEDIHATSISTTLS